MTGNSHYNNKKEKTFHPKLNEYRFFFSQLPTIWILILKKTQRNSIINIIVIKSLLTRKAVSFLRARLDAWTKSVLMRLCTRSWYINTAFAKRVPFTVGLRPYLTRFFQMFFWVFFICFFLHDCIAQKVSDFHQSTKHWSKSSGHFHQFRISESDLSYTVKH